MARTEFGSLVLKKPDAVGCACYPSVRQHEGGGHRESAAHGPASWPCAAYERDLSLTGLKGEMAPSVAFINTQYAQRLKTNKCWLNAGCCRHGIFNAFQSWFMFWFCGLKCREPLLYVPMYPAWWKFMHSHLRTLEILSSKQVRIFTKCFLWNSGQVSMKHKQQFSFICLFVCLLWGRVSLLRSSVWPGTHSIDQASLQLWEIHLLLSPKSW